MVDYYPPLETLGFEAPWFHSLSLEIWLSLFGFSCFICFLDISLVPLSTSVLCGGVSSEVHIRRGKQLSSASKNISSHPEQAFWRWASEIWALKAISASPLYWVNFFPTTPGFGHQLDIAFKIVPHALFVNLHNPIQWSVISRPFVGLPCISANCRTY